jgi:hypothetical protein
MANRQGFGRRIDPQAANKPPQSAVPAQPAAAPPNATGAAAASPISAFEEPSVDSELRAWKQARGSRFKMPWSQLSLMASLCFGIASFVLPDSVNSNVDWLLWGLAIMSGWVWYSNRRKKKLTSHAAP